MSFQEHQQSASPIAARFAVITLSDTRTPDTDISGQRIRQLITTAGHSVAGTLLIPDDPARLKNSLDTLFSRDDVDAIITTGGTGISRRDQTVTVAESLIEKPLPGFGELFRMLSWEQIGAGAMLSRAVAGVARGKLLFCLPGSTAAVELAMEKLILPGIKHLIRELRR